MKFNLSEISRESKTTETESKYVVAWGWVSMQDPPANRHKGTVGDDIIEIF